MILIIVLYALFGTSFPISKFLLGYVGPQFFTGVRMVIAGTLLLFYQFLYTRGTFHFKRNHAKYFIQIIIIGVYLTYALRFWGLAKLPAAKTAFLFNLTPFFSAFYAYLMFKEKLSLKQWIGLGIGFLGFIPILLTSSTSEKLLGELIFISWPEIAVIAAVACSSYSWLLMQKLIKHKKYPSAEVNGICFLVGGIMALITSYFVEPFTTIVDPGTFLSWLAIVTITSNIICHNLYAHLLKKYSATFLSFAGFLGPLFAALYGWLFLQEKITWHFGASALFVFIGLFIFYQDEFTSEFIEQPDL